MSTLRDALEDAIRRKEGEADRPYLLRGKPDLTILVAVLRDLLAAHPAEPAPTQTEAAGIRAFDDPDRADLAEILGATGVRMLLAHPAEPAPVATRERVADLLHSEKHGGGCTYTNRINCGGWRDAVQEAAALLAAGVFRDEAEVKAEVLREIRNEIGVEQDDPTIPYVTVQIGREAWAELEASRG